MRAWPTDVIHVVVFVVLAISYRSVHRICACSTSTMATGGGGSGVLGVLGWFVDEETVLGGFRAAGLKEAGICGRDNY